MKFLFKEIYFITGCDQRSVKGKQYFQWDLEASLSHPRYV